jgi:hypothetical protein
VRWNFLKPQAEGDPQDRVSKHGSRAFDPGVPRFPFRLCHRANGARGAGVVMQPLHGGHEICLA